MPVQSDGLNSILSPVVYGDIEANLCFAIFGKNSKIAEYKNKYTQKIHTKYCFAGAMSSLQWGTQYARLTKVVFQKIIKGRSRFN